jgi:hypothetical protein
MAGPVDALLSGFDKLNRNVEALGNLAAIYAGQPMVPVTVDAPRLHPIKSVIADTLIGQTACVRLLSGNPGIERRRLVALQADISATAGTIILWRDKLSIPDGQLAPPTVSTDPRMLTGMRFPLLQTVTVNQTTYTIYGGLRKFIPLYHECGADEALYGWFNTPVAGGVSCTAYYVPIPVK